MSQPLPLWLPLTDWSCKKLLILRKEITPHEAKVMTMDQIEQHVERFAKEVGERINEEMDTYEDRICPNCGYVVSYNEFVSPICVTECFRCDKRICSSCQSEDKQYCVECSLNDDMV